MSNLPKILVIVGPTASGKTALAIKLARRSFSGKNLGGRAQKYDCEIVSADSRQIYRGMDIGTAKIKLNTNRQQFDCPELAVEGSPIANIPHHLIDIKNPDEDYSVEEYKHDAIRAINGILKRGHLPILVGGTGLYIRAVVDNLTIPEVKADARLRKRLEAQIKKEGLAAVAKKLISLDPEAASIVDLRNPRRVVRALEIALKTNKPFSESQKSSPPLYEAIQIGLYPGKKILEKRIEKRTKEMLKSGLIREVKSLLKKYSPNSPRRYGEASQQCKAFVGIGYREVIDYLNGKISLPEAEQLIDKNTIHYAKRQMTWFKKDKRIKWIKNPKRLSLSDLVG